MTLQKRIMSISKEKYAIRCTFVRPWELDFKVTLVKDGKEISFTVKDDIEGGDM